MDQKTIKRLGQIEKALAMYREELDDICDELYDEALSLPDRSPLAGPAWDNVGRLDKCEDYLLYAIGKLQDIQEVVE